PVVTAGPQPTEGVLGYSLMMDRYRDLSGSLDFVDALEEQLPELLFILVPMEEEGDPYFRLMAGPATTIGAANALKGPIGEVLTRENPATWLVRETPLAYYVGETQTLEAAHTRVASLTGMGIPAYVLQVTFPDGAEAFRLYAGAYASAEDAEILLDVLESNGLGDAPLIERRGRLPE
ncbi:SPOR domain-containing protein, partial [Gemmatimonadota bacterium]